MRQELEVSAAAVEAVLERSLVVAVQGACEISKVCNRFFTMGQGAGSRVGTRWFQAMGQLDSSYGSTGFKLYKPHLVLQHEAVLGVERRGEDRRDAVVLRRGVHVQPVVRGGRRLHHRGHACSFMSWCRVWFVSACTSFNTRACTSFNTRRRKKITMAVIAACGRGHLCFIFNEI
jgi:hypothetical protein